MNGLRRASATFQAVQADALDAERVARDSEDLVGGDLVDLQAVRHLDGTEVSAFCVEHVPEPRPALPCRGGCRLRVILSRASALQTSNAYSCPCAMQARDPRGAITV